MPITPSSFKHWKSRLHTVIFESHTRAGKMFDVVLLILILLSISVVLIDSMAEFHNRFGNVFYIIEWIFTILFTIEYILRIISLRSPKKYAVSYLGIIDLLSIIPTYLSLFFIGAQSLLVLRVLRLLRVFRIFKLNHYLSEMNFLSVALKNSTRKISIFMLCVLFLVLIFGSLMYLVESGTNGFTSIPASIYWAIVTITTVGYGDVAPVTGLGKLIAGLIMLLGYGIIAVPTGIVTTEMAIAAREKKTSHEACPNCGKEGHDADARHCKFCGAKL